MEKYDVITDFCDNVFEFITGCNRPHNCFLVRKHTEDLQTHGDFSFPNSPKAWNAYLRPELVVKDCVDGNLLKSLGKSENQFIENSKLWRLSISSIKESKGRLHIFLDRNVALPVAFHFVNNAAYIVYDTLQNYNIEISSSEDDITSLRVDFLNESLQYVCRLLYPSNKTEFSVRITKNQFENSELGRNILCGPVLNANTSMKETTITKMDYIRMRKEELALIAQHRYGLKLSKESKWNQLIEELGVAVAKFELLQAKPTSPVKISFENSATGANKGPAFVLYNCARMETIKRTFNEKVEQKLYPALPSLDQTDLGLLTQEEEWNLIFNYVLGFPTMLRSSFEMSENCCEFRPQLICNFLYSFVKIFSQYYRKTRILTEPRTHLLPVLFARIHFINALCGVMQATLRILGIKHIPHM